MIKNFWILCKSGAPMYMQGLADENVNVLLSGFLGAIQMLAGNIDNSRLNKIELENHTYYYSMIDPIISVIEADTADEIESRTYQVLAVRLGQAFISKYSQDVVDNFCGDVELFSDFNQIYTSLISEYSQIVQDKKKDFILKYYVEAASNENILGVMVYDLNLDEIISKDVPITLSIKNFESFGSMLFSFIDRLGKELKAGSINEILIRAENYWIGGFRKGDLAVFMLFTPDYFGKVLPAFVSAALDNK